LKVLTNKKVFLPSTIGSLLICPDPGRTPLRLL
jgi:hypothetical protein